MLPRRRPSSTPSRSPSDDLSHVGRADAVKKMRICQIKERLPRIARLAHLNTQTPRTPRTPRAKNSTTTAENKRVGRRWSPPGGLQLNPPPHRGRACQIPRQGLQNPCQDPFQPLHNPPLRHRPLPPRALGCMLGASWPPLGRKSRAPRGLPKTIKF